MRRMKDYLKNFRAYRVIKKSGLFDAAYYLKTYPEVRHADIDPVKHYLSFGAFEGRSPNLFFDTNYYLKHNPDIDPQVTNPLHHYIVYGEKEGRKPNPDFDPQWYWEFYADVRNAGLSPLLHYAGYGREEKRFQSKVEFERNEAFKVLNESHLFDREYYLTTYNDVHNADIDPVWHYILCGAHEHRNPSAHFNTAYYLETTSEIDPQVINPLHHYIICGEKEGRKPNPDFDPQWYLDFYADVRTAGLSPLLHYVVYGRAEERFRSKVEFERNEAFKALNESRLFDKEYYLKTYKDVHSADIDPVWHYILCGAQEHRNPNANFNTAYYLETTPDIDPQFINPLYHYIIYGEKDGRNPNPPDTFGYTEFGGDRSFDKNARTILLVAHAAGNKLFGGERSFIDMVEAVSVLGYNVVITLPSAKNNSYIDYLRVFAQKIIVFRYSWWRDRKIIDESTVAKFADIITTYDVGLVHVNTIMLREPLVAARRLCVPSIVHVRELVKYDQALSGIIGESPEVIIETVQSGADYIFANSNATASSFYKENAIYLLPNTIDFSLATLTNIIEPKKIRVALISSNLPKKGIYDFVELAKLFDGESKEIQFILIGPNNEFVDDIKTAQVAGEGPKNIEFIDYCENPLDALTHANIVLSLSHFQESFGRTILEAMAAGRVVVAYDWGAVSELVSSEKTGFLVRFKDIPALAKKIQYLHQNPSAISVMGEAAREVAITSYNKDRYRTIMKNAYEDIFNRHAIANSGSLSLRARELYSPHTNNPEKLPGLRIAYFLWHFPVPSETFVLNELRFLVENGNDIHVFCRRSPFAEFSPDFNIEWECVDSPEQLADRLRETGRTVVHSHFTYPTVTDMVWPACEIAGIPFTFIAHAQDIFRYDNDQKNRVREISMSPFCLKVFVPAEFHRDYLISRGVPENKLCINPNGIEPELYFDNLRKKQYDKRSRSICAIHRFTEKKGLSTLILAAHILEQHNISIHLYGYGELETTYKDLIAQRKITNVQLHGPVKTRDEILTIFSKHDLFVCPSVRASNGDMDGIPTVLMEAMASGIPVLTTAISGIPELVRDGVTGLVCEATPESITKAVLRYYSMPESRVAAIADAARNLVQNSFNTRTLTATLLRFWQQKTFDIIIVSFNNLVQLREVIHRLYSFTSLPFHLIICDNGSDRDVIAFLCSLYAAKENVTVLLNRDNVMVGPGTNIALEQSWSDYAVYLCGKEGFILRHGWERSLITYMDSNPKVGLAGSIGHAPNYLYGHQYPEAIAEFPLFRNKQYAFDNPNHVFGHVQGGLFILRRAMYERIGGFSNDIPHNYTDVEYSYYVESCEHKLGCAPNILALYNKTRPGIFSRIDENVLAVHPPKMSDLPLLDLIVRREVKYCNVCGWSGARFLVNEHEAKCPSCSSLPFDRSLYRLLAESTLLYRRLPAIGVNVGTAMQNFWKQQFQGDVLEGEQLFELFSDRKRLDFPDNRLELIYLNCLFSVDVDSSHFFDEFRRVLTQDGVLIIRNPVEQGVSGYLTNENIRENLTTKGFGCTESIRFDSFVLEFDWQPFLIFSSYKIDTCKRWSPIFGQCAKVDSHPLTKEDHL